MNGNRRSVWKLAMHYVFGIIMFIVLVGVVLFPIFGRPRRTNGHGSCLNNLKQLGTGFNMYESDWDDRFPALRTLANSAPEGQGWVCVTIPYLRNRKVFSCPGDPQSHRVEQPYVPLSYSFNRRLSGMKEKDVRGSAEVALLWDTPGTALRCNNANGDHIWRWGDADWPKTGDYIVWPYNADGRCENWPELAKPRHHGANNVCYADGHARQCPPCAVPRLSPK